MTAVTAVTATAPIGTAPIGTAPTPALPVRESGTGLLHRLRAHLDRRRTWRDSLRRERALQRAVANAPTEGAAHETAALLSRR